MRLVDCFVELVAYVAYFIKTVPSGQTTFDQVQTDVTHLIGKSQDNYHRSRLPQDDFDLARFAVFAWIDESILNSNWSEKSRWQSELLQRTYYQTSDAGEQFFDKLNILAPHQLEVREVYYLCLALGFTGRYCNPGDELLLEQLKNSNLNLLGNIPDPRSFEQEPIFPDAYLKGDTRSPKTKEKRRLSTTLILGTTLPILLYGVLFFIYRFVLDNVGANIISSVQ